VTRYDDSTGKTGWLTPVGDATSLANAMAWYGLNLKCANKWTGRRQRAVDTFSVQATGRVFLEVYAELLQN